MRSLCDGFLWIGLRIGVRGKEEQGLQVRAHEMGVAGRAGYVYRWLSPSVPDFFTSYHIHIFFQFIPKKF